MVYEYDVRRLCDLIETVACYNAVSKKSGQQECHIGLTVTITQKLCYFCDFDHFEKYGESITDCIYVRTPKGPSPIFFHKALRELVTDGRISLNGDMIIPSDESVSGVDVALCTELFDSDKWSHEELITIIDTVSKYSGYSEKELVGLSRKDNPSRIAGEYQALDYNAAYYRRPFYSVRGDADE